MRILALLLLWLSLSAANYLETPYFADKVKAGDLPPVADRLPETPDVEPFADAFAEPGREGGSINILMASAKDVRQMVVYGYARLVGYNHRLELEPDILERYTVEDGRIFTLYLRKGHKWSDGKPFTSDDFRYWWEDMANNPELSPSGPPIEMLVDGEPPVVEYPDDTTVRYTWPKPNPTFLPALAGARPLYIYAPKHYLKKYHPRYADPAKLEERVKKSKRRNWASLHNRKDNAYKNDNPDLPTLEPWRNTTKAPAERFVFERNPFYHRVDPQGRQLPYIDQVIMGIASSGLIPAKAGSGESDLQARYLRFDNISFLKQNEDNHKFHTLLWRTGKGAELALYPNLNIEDPVWRALFRDVRFRRALSLAVNRHEINQVIFYGRAVKAGPANTVLPASPLYDTMRDTRWTQFDLKRANALLDEIGLKRGPGGIRRLPDGRPLEIIVETAGESTEQVDALQLVHDSWLDAGIKIFTKPLQREVLRNRIFAGQTQMAIWFGLENGLATAEMSPAELAPTTQQQLQWPRWGQYYETKGQSGAPIDMPEPQLLFDLYRDWREARTDDARRAIWRDMLDIWTDQVFTIGLAAGAEQPVVVSNRLHNIPANGFYNWDPGAHFGCYRPDRFWLTPE
ncbi:MAG: ABC transporter substrate-binding protein [Alphaproteobacteria bacterium]|nr:ABC transporter substrate-binding protein [Alphaproteobacteria bacterium]MCB9930157.1 ABC transporter substrate-binding protein [Alphaproteobacteria bacterium]